MADDRQALRATFQNSEFPQGIHRAALDEDPMMLSNRTNNSNGGLNSVRQTEMKITAADIDGELPVERKADYKGRIKTWPGILLLLGIVGAATALISIGAIHAHNKSTSLAATYEENLSGGRKIKDGMNSSGDIVSDDGQIGNPKTYPNMSCELPNYLSKNGQIYAVSKNGTEVAIGIKGVNWFGMETGQAIPFGLWENDNNGTTAYEIASFLARNKFNSVRLPVCIKSLLDKTVKPDKTLINLNTNRAIDVTSYMSTIKSIVQVLAYRHVTVMISLHTLTTRTSGGAWYSSALGVSEDDFLDAVDILTSNLCKADYWNIIGLDLKNEPHECTWGGGAPDWQKGATLIGNRMLKGCPNWLAFVEGINGAHKITTTDRAGTYYDWWGGGLQNAGEDPVVLSKDSKVVYAPHFYNTGVSVQWYLYAAGTDPTVTYKELDDETLKNNVYAVFEDMFGYLTKKQTGAVLLGEFAGLYATDKHPLLTTKRTTDYTIQAAIEKGLAGGYMWSLNPESAYQHNPANVEGNFVEGLLMSDWLTPNAEFVKGMAAMDQIRDLKMFPCFPTTSK